MLSSVHSYSQVAKVDLVNYQKKFDRIDTSIFFDQYLEVSNYVFGGIRSIVITAKRKDIPEIKSSFYIDSLKHYFRSGHVKRIQTYDSIGTPLTISVYERSGHLKYHCDITYDGTYPFDESKSSDLKYNIQRYKNGILVDD
jgi:hypothetical protein